VAFVIVAERSAIQWLGTRWNRGAIRDVANFLAKQLNDDGRFLATGTNETESEPRLQAIRRRGRFDFSSKRSQGERQWDHWDRATIRGSRDASPFAEPECNSVLVR
jgi:hypothetical protein